MPILVKSHIQKLDATFQKKKIYWIIFKNTLWFQQYMTLLLWSTKKELWVIFCLRPGSDEKYSCEFLQVETWQGIVYKGEKWLQHFKKEKFLAKAVIKNMIYLMLDPGYMCAEHEVAKWCLLSAITFFIWLACLNAEKEVYLKNYWCQISKTHNVCLCDYYLQYQEVALTESYIEQEGRADQAQGLMQRELQAWTKRKTIRRRLRRGGT